MAMLAATEANEKDIQQPEPLTWQEGNQKTAHFDKAISDF